LNAKRGSVTKQPHREQLSPDSSSAADIIIVASWHLIQPLPILWIEKFLDTGKIARPFPLATVAFLAFLLKEEVHLHVIFIFKGGGG
jgi:hypothetical protein